MISIKATGGMGGDATYPYDVIMDRPYTVREFVDEVLAEEGNWGCIRVSDNPRDALGELICWYRHGKLEEEYASVKKYESIQVKSAHGSGGWSMYDFTLMV